jgi:hypothetical protein
MDIDVKSLRKKMIGLRGTDNYDKVSKYLLDMKRVLCEMHRVLKEDKYLAIVIGTDNSQLQKISEYIGKVRSRN